MNELKEGGRIVGGVGPPVSDPQVHRMGFCQLRLSGQDLWSGLVSKFFALFQSLASPGLIKLPFYA